MILYYVVRIIGFLLFLMGYRGRHFFGTLVGTAVYKLNDKQRNIVLENLSPIIADDKLRRHTAKCIFQNYTRYYLEVLISPYLLGGKRTAPLGEPNLAYFRKYFKVEGIQQLVSAHQNRESAIISSLHMGNWDLAGMYMASMGMPINAVAERLKNQQLFEYFRKIREKMGIQVIPLVAGASKKVEAVLRDHQIVALMSDRDISRRGIKVILFGRTVSMPAGPVVMALRTGAFIVPAYLVRTSQGYKGVVEEPLQMVITGNTEVDVQHNSQLLMDRLSQIIRKYPEQWCMLQKIYLD